MLILLLASFSEVEAVLGKADSDPRAGKLFSGVLAEEELESHVGKESVLRGEMMETETVEFKSVGVSFSAENEITVEIT